jgi:intracellular sulfur oxidation DsrE/DsrF family protein
MTASPSTVPFPFPSVRRRSARAATRALPALAALLLVPALATAQGRQDVPGMQPSGPVIQSTGFTVKVDNPSFAIPEGHLFKAVWVIDRADTTGVNAQLTTIARFLNVHARHGIPESRLQTAAVVHGGGWSALLTDEAFGARYGGKPNPSKALVQELLQHGTTLVLCGQTAGLRGVKQEELLPGVQLAISAMTALNVFQAQGYQMNPW